MTLAEELLAAGDDDSLPPKVRALVRLAAEVLLEAELDADYQTLIRNEVVRDRLISHGRLPFDWLDEDSETEGSA